MADINIRNSEADTRAELIEPKLKESGWIRSDKIRIAREYPITIGRIIDSKNRGEKLSADYALIYRNQIIGIIEAKKTSISYTEGINQAKKYAKLLNIRYAYSTNGNTIYQIDMETGEEKTVSSFPSPDKLWDMTFTLKNELWNLLSSIPDETSGGKYNPRYYQTNAVNAVIKAMAQGKKRILLTLATGTGKTCIAFQIVWKLFNAKWNTKETGTRNPRILFLADRNILANQAFNSFGAFKQDSLCRIKPNEIKKNGTVPTAQNIFFTIFQTFMSGPNETPYFGQYEKDFFDFIIIDECHRGGANDESQWRAILEYFDSAVQLGLTATPKRKGNVDTYKYFGEPVYQYSLKDAINDGFLTPFRVREINDNMGTYEYNPNDDIEGEIDKEKTYTENDFNRKIQMPEREITRVKRFMSEINQADKTLVFCATQAHAGFVRDIINQVKNNTNPDYCVRVTANDGEDGEEFLRKFQDTEKSIPTILTTSQKLSTGVDAIQIKNIVLMRPVNSMIEFKQIIGRGTRLCDDKAYFTIYDFVGASKNFKDPEWDGEPEPPTIGKNPPGKSNDKKETNKKDTNIFIDEYPEEKQITKITLGNGREVEITSTRTTFWDASGKPISAKEFIEKLFNTLPNFFKSEEELRQIWSNPETRKQLLNKLKNIGYSIENFEKIKQIINAEDNDIFDVLIYLAYAENMISRRQRVENNKVLIFNNIQSRQQAFIDFVLNQYIKNGVSELDDERIGDLINLKYGSPADAVTNLGNISDIRNAFCSFQKYLYK